MKIALWADHAGYELKEKVKGFLEELGAEFQDLGVNSLEPVDYPLPTADVARQMEQGMFERAILICGTGIGTCIVANKVPGIRAANCSSHYDAVISRRHNDANVLCLGGRVLGSEVAREIVTAWLSNDFEGGRHERRLTQLKEIERRYLK